MTDSTTPAPVCTRPAALCLAWRLVTGFASRHPPKTSVALPLSTFGGHRPASTVHAHPGTAAAGSII
jgi:hypothetical protein